MNDRFKFRVWCKSLGKYIDNVNLSPKGFLFYSGSIFATDEDDFIVEQCTGLKDKNGNLIYEYDIVRYSYSGKGIVRFGKYTGCFACGWENIYQDLIGWYLDDYYDHDDSGCLRIDLDNTHRPITEEDVSDLEIIGNIHEQKGE